VIFLSHSLPRISDDFDAPVALPALDPEEAEATVEELRSRIDRLARANRIPDNGFLLEILTHIASLETLLEKPASVYLNELALIYALVERAAK